MEPVIYTTKGQMFKIELEFCLTLSDGTFKNEGIAQWHVYLDLTLFPGLIPGRYLPCVCSQLVLGFNPALLGSVRTLYPVVQPP